MNRTKTVVSAFSFVLAGILVGVALGNFAPRETESPTALEPVTKTVSIPVEKVVYRDRIVTEWKTKVKTVEVPVEKIVYVDKIVTKTKTVVEKATGIPKCDFVDSPDCHWPAYSGYGNGLEFINFDGKRFYVEGATQPTEKVLYCDEYQVAVVNTDENGNSWASCEDEVVD